MPKYIKTDKLQNNIFVPLNLSEQIIEGTLSYTIQYIIDNKINIKPFEKKIANDKTGRPAYNPKILLKLILFAYANGFISSRSIQNLARQNIIAMALSENTTPDFTVIAEFISNMKNEITDIFINVLLIASEMNLLGNTTFALDGCKLSSNASKENSGTFYDLKKKQKKISDKIKYLIDIHNSNDSSEMQKNPAEVNKTIEKLTKKIEKIEKFLKENKRKIGKRYKENQSNITDNESAKMKTGHGVLQGYNGQAMADDKHQIIISAEVFGQGSDTGLLETILDKAKNNYVKIGKQEDFFKGKTIIADTGYFSEDNLKVTDKMEVDAYIPDQFFRKRDIRFKTNNRYKEKKSDRFSREDFKYDMEKETVTCPAGHDLKLSKGKDLKVKKFTYKRYLGKKTICSVCLMRNKCLKNENVRYRIFQIAINEEGREYTKEMIKKIDTVKGRYIYSRRMSIIEPVFANIRVHKKLNHFTLRGKSKVNIQWLLFCIVHNISKITRYGDIRSLKK